MSERKSLLNPDAAPYIPMSKMFSGMSFEGEYKASEAVSVDSGKNGKVEGLADYRVVDNAVVEYNTQNPDRVYAACSPKIAQKTGVAGSDSFVDESDKYSVTVDPDLDMLSSMFPGISRQSLGELLKLNHGDLSDTIDMLEQLDECEDDIPETSGFGGAQ